MVSAKGRSIPKDVLQVIGPGLVRFAEPTRLDNHETVGRSASSTQQLFVNFVRPQRTRCKLKSVFKYVERVGSGKGAEETGVE